MKKCIILVAAVVLVAVLATRDAIRADSVGVQVADADLAAIRGGVDCKKTQPNTCEPAFSTCEAGGCELVEGEQVCKNVGGHNYHNDLWTSCVPAAGGWYQCSDPLTQYCNILEVCGPECEQMGGGMWVCNGDDSGHSVNGHEASWAEVFGCNAA